MSAHIERARWPVLLAPDQADTESVAERAVAEAHAVGCADCARDRRWAEELLSILSELSTVERTSPVVPARIRQEILVDLWTPKSRLALRWESAAAVAGFAAIVATARTRDLGGATALWALALLAGAVLVLRSRRAAWLIGPLALAAAAALSSSFRFEVGHGVACSVMELFAAALPVAALSAMVRFRALRATPNHFAVAAAAGALAGQAALALTCPTHSFGHLLVFHVFVVGVAALMGSALGRWQTAAARS